MSYISKNLKIFSSFHIPNDENSNNSDNFAKLKFFDDETDLRVWGCNAWRRQQYNLEMMSGKKNRVRAAQATRQMPYSSRANSKEDLSNTEFIQPKIRGSNQESNRLRVKSSPNLSSQDEIRNKSRGDISDSKPNIRSVGGTRHSSPNRSHYRRNYNNDYFESNMQLSDNHTSYFTPEGEGSNVVSIYFDDNSNFPTVNGEPEFSTKVEIQRSDCSIQTIYINDNPKICRVCKKLKRDYD